MYWWWSSGMFFSDGSCRCSSAASRTCAWAEARLSHWLKLIGRSAARNAADFQPTVRLSDLFWLLPFCSVTWELTMAFGSLPTSAGPRGPCQPDTGTPSPPEINLLPHWPIIKTSTVGEGDWRKTLFYSKFLCWRALSFLAAPQPPPWHPLLAPPNRPLGWESKEGWLGFERPFSGERQPSVSPEGSGKIHSSSMTAPVCSAAAAPYQHTSCSTSCL